MECKQGRVCAKYVIQKYILILDKIQTFLVLIRNAEVCGDGECKWVVDLSETDSYEEPYKDSSYEDGPYEDGSYEDGSYEDGSYEDDSSEEPRKTRYKRTTPVEIQ